MRRIVGMVAALVMAGAVSPAGASAAAVKLADNVVVSSAHWSGSTVRCLDTGSFDEGSDMVSAPCHGKGSQRFDIYNDGTIRMNSPSAKGKCLEDVGDRRAIKHKACVAASKAQKWYVNNIPGLPRTHDAFKWKDEGGALQNEKTGRCMDIKDASFDTGAYVISYGCSTSESGEFLGPGNRPWNQVWGVGDYGLSGKAMILLRNNPPPPYLGHVGWAITRTAGVEWVAGAWDGFNAVVIRKGDYNGHWKHGFDSSDEVLKWFAREEEGKLRLNPVYRQSQIDPGSKSSKFMHTSNYDRYKLITVTKANPAAALAVEAQSWRWGYGGLANNCLDQTIRILRAFGATSQIPKVGDDWTPRAYFLNKVPGGTGKFLPGRESLFG